MKHLDLPTRSLRTRTALLMLLLTASQSMLAGPRSLQQAKAIAAQFATAQSATPVSADEFTPVTSAKEAKAIGGQATPAYYILNQESTKGGYVIVSGDDRFKAVLGYSTTGTFEASTLPEGFSYWFQFIGEEIAAATAYYDANGIQTTSQAKRLPGSNVAPMLKSHWGQGTPFNQAVVVEYNDPNNDSYNGHAAVGCVALSMAQLMNFWKYPTQGQGGVYEHSRYQDLSMNFDEVTYNWDLIQDNYGVYLVGDGDPLKSENFREEVYTPEQAQEVAKLCYHAGFAANMVWNAAGNGESSTQAACALRALINQFGYNRYAYMQLRDPILYEDFHALLVNELEDGRPVLYSGEDGQTHAGHFFILDGYDAEQATFHVNWGWQGQYDGYYALTALEPGVGGIGAGTGNYNYYQGAIIGIQPTEKAYPYTLGITAISMDVTQNSIPRNTNALVAVQQLANNDPIFQGKFGLAVYSLDGVLQTERMIDITNFDIGSAVSGEFPTPHFLDLAEGDYLMKFVAKSDKGEYFTVHSAYGTTECWLVNVVIGSNPTPANPGTVTFTAYDDIDPIITGIDDIDPIITGNNGEATVEYFTLSGTKIAAPNNGVAIRKTTFADGTVKSEKVFRSK